MSKKHINIVSWMATEKDPNRIQYIHERLSRDYTIDNILYIYQQGFSETLKAVQKVLGDILKPIRVELPIYKDTPNGNPWNHKDVYGILKYIIPKISSYENLYVNVSSGTYAIHAAWLILHAGGSLPPGTKLIVADAEKKLFHEVDFPIKTYLGEIREYEKKHPKEPTYRLDSESPKRIAALEKITAYASMKRRPMLLLGERGTGKSRIVESYVSAIKNRKNVVAVVCGSFAKDPGMAESALFGHKKGAFSGATNDEKGFLEEADGGILFLDEIQDLPKLVQRKLLRTLQDNQHRYRRVGEQTEKKSDFELVCASNLSEKELKERLDLDFYDRISFFKVKLPPLRECPEDLRDDWEKVWIAESSGLESLPTAAPDDDCLMAFFKASQLPGNFRTLELVANHIIAWNGRKSIEDILKDLTFDNDEKKEFASHDFSTFENKSWQEATRCFQQHYAEYACKKYGTQSEAAKKLGCTPKTLQNAMKNKPSTQSSDKNL